jgi:hypothetical protein
MTGWVCPELVNLQQAADRLAAACPGRGACGYGKQAFAEASGNARLGTIAAWPMTKISPPGSGT